MSRRDRGASAVEFAIVLPVLFLIVAGIVDFGRAYFTQIQLANAAREGARAAVVLPLGSTPAPTTEVPARVSAALPGLTDAAMTPTYCPSSANSTARATVVVSRPFRWIVLGPAMKMFGGTLADGSISATGVMQCGG